MTNTYVGIADAHGIESWNRIEDTSSQDRAMRQIRVNANRQRHAVYYEADVPEEHAKEIEEMLGKSQWETALLHLKKHAEELRGVRGQDKSWELIPNPDLDPWS
jgi:formate-dependent nitrite reductase cytochrome c552 subunit